MLTLQFPDQKSTYYVSIEPKCYQSTNLNPKRCDKHPCHIYMGAHPSPRTNDHKLRIVCNTYISDKLSPSPLNGVVQCHDLEEEANKSPADGRGAKPPPRSGSLVKSGRFSK